MDLSSDIVNFLSQCGWQDARHVAITPDWSPRHYWRLMRGYNESAVLVHAPKLIPGHSLAEFSRLSERLRIMGLSTPKVYAETLTLMLLEDFGDVPIDTAPDESEAYATAVDVLAVLRQNECSDIIRYEDGYIYKKLGLYSSDPAWMAAWQTITQSLPPAPHCFSHMDYKAGNLHWLPHRTGIKRIGILDFQAAQQAPFTYDIVNLLEDARRDIDPALKTSLKARFKSALPDDWKPLFDDWYTVMAAQFHARVLGQIKNIPHAAPDIAPRLKHYLAEASKAPVLAPLRVFLAN
jgi:aminoglycoside/choline kinase family phosphotransferase